MACSRTVVAVVVLWRGRIGLFRRSATADHDQGMWHCVTGYVEQGHSALSQAVAELHEETGLGAADLDSLVAGEVLELPDSRGDLWQVHTFRAVTSRRRLVLNDKHDHYRWVEPRAVARFGNRVSWLGEVLRAADAIGQGCVPAHAGRAEPM